MSTGIDELVSAVQSRIEPRCIGRHITGFNSVSSTNIIAKQALLDGEPTGSVLVTDYQSAGRGRLGRKWLAEPGVNLMFSVILRPPQEFVSVTGMLTSLALRRAIEPFTSPVPLLIKWPNDLLLEGRKCSGMLMEYVTGGMRGDGVVLGIGLNVNQASFPDVDAPNATSLLLATGRHMSRADVLARILIQLDSVMTDIDHGAVARAVAEYERYMFRLGETVSLFLAGSGKEVSGRILGLRNDGALRLETDAGEEHFYAGDITTRRPSKDI